MDFINVHSEVRLVTPQQAREMRDTMHFPRQRNISDKNVDRLAVEMHFERFTDGTQIYICILPDGKRYIVNGNHTLEAIYKSGVAQWLTLTYKKVANQDAAGQIYAVFDTQRVRTWNDSLRAMGLEEETPMARLVMPAVRLIDAAFAEDASSSERTQTIGHISRYKEPAALLYAIMVGPKSGDGHKFLKRSPVLAVALETALHQPSAAHEFWGAFVQDDGLSAKSPEKALLVALAREKGVTGYAARRVQIRLCAAAWNAAFQGESRCYLKPASMIAFYLLGTPWDKGVAEAQREKTRSVDFATLTAQTLSDGQLV